MKFPNFVLAPALPYPGIGFRDTFKEQGRSPVLRGYVREPSRTEIRADRQAASTYHLHHEYGRQFKVLVDERKLAQALDILADWAGRSQSRRKAIQDGGSPVKQDPSENVVERHHDDLRVDNLCGPSCANPTFGIFRARGAGSLHTALLHILPRRLQFSDPPLLVKKDTRLSYSVHSINRYTISSLSIFHSLTHLRYFT